MASATPPLAAPPAAALSTSAAAFELKTAALTLLAVVLKTTDSARWAAALNERFAESPGLFENDPVAIDLYPVRDAIEPLELERLIGLLREHGMRPVAVRGGSPAQTAAALAAGLVEADAAGGAGPRPVAETKPPEIARVAPVDSAAVAGARVPAAAPAEATRSRPTQIVDKPLRSGQLVYARGADLVVLSVVSFGAEVIADGNIHVYAPLRGRALAGARGDTSARIFTTCLDPQLISIAGIYRTAETTLPAAVLGRPAQVRLDGEKLVVEPLQPD